MSTSFRRLPPAPLGKKWIFRKTFRNRYTGKLMVAAHYGKKAWAFLVPV